MTKPPRTPPSSTGAPRPPAASPSPKGAGAPPASDRSAANNPFASLASSSLGDPGGETKLYEVPRELIEIARAKAAEAKASTGTLTPIAPRPNAELEATLAAYTAGLNATGSRRAPSSQPARGEPLQRQTVEAPSSQPARRCEESGTVLRPDAARATPPSSGHGAPQQAPGTDSRQPLSVPADSLRRSGSRPRSEALERASARPVPSSARVAGEPPLRGPVASRSTPAARSPSAPVASGKPQTRLWVLSFGLGLLLAYCAYLLLLR